LGPDRDACDKDAFEDAVRVGLVQVPVLVDVRLPLVAVADHELGFRLGLTPGFPLDARREASASAASHLGGGHLRDRFFLAHLEENLEIALVGTPGDRVLDRIRLDDAGVAGQELDLVLEEVMLVQRTDVPDRLVTAHTDREVITGAIDDAGDICLRNGAVDDRELARALDFDPRLHPERAVPAHLADDRARAGDLADGVQHLERALGDRAGANAHADDGVVSVPHPGPAIDGRFLELLEGFLRRQLLEMLARDRANHWIPRSRSLPRDPRGRGSTTRSATRGSRVPHSGHRS